MEKIKIAIVDDSLVFRKVLESVISEIPELELTDSIWNGKKAIDILNDYADNSPEKLPQLITLDVEMPDFNGIDTLKAIQQFNLIHTELENIEVIMLSSYTRDGALITMSALNEGAMDFITKPNKTNPDDNFNLLKMQLLNKVNDFKEYLELKEENSFEKQIKETTLELSKGVNAIAIGVSTGGPKALSILLPELCRATNIPIFIVQHMPPKFTKYLAENLDQVCEAKVCEAKDNEEVQKSTVYIAPGDKHMLVRKIESKYYISLNANPHENSCRPSIDVLNRSIASVFEGNSISIMLTGMGNDGVKSLDQIKRAGGIVIAQDKESSVVWGIPGRAVESGNVDFVLPLSKIAQKVKSILNDE